MKISIALVKALLCISCSLDVWSPNHFIPEDRWLVVWSPLVVIQRFGRTVFWGQEVKGLTSLDNGQLPGGDVQLL